MLDPVDERSSAAAGCLSEQPEVSTTTGACSATDDGLTLINELTLYAQTQTRVAEATGSCCCQTCQGHTVCLTADAKLQM